MSFTQGGPHKRHAAKAKAASDPANTVFNTRRFLGRTWNDDFIQQGIRDAPYKVINNDGRPSFKIELDGQTTIYSPEESSAMILTQMKRIAEMNLQRKITHAIVTVPAYFNEPQRQAIKTAGVIADLTILHLVNKASAAAIGYGLDQSIGEERMIIICDLSDASFE